MQIQDGKGRDREERNERFRAPRRLASSDGKARCSRAHTTSITGLASDDHKFTSRNRHVSARTLLQSEGSEDTVNRENMITNMEVSDADVVKAVNSGFFLERRCCRTMTGLILSDRVQSGRGVP